MPGVLIVEALAQAGSIPIIEIRFFQRKTAYLGGLNNVKFRQKVTPGDVNTFGGYREIKSMQESQRRCLCRW